MQQMQRKRWMPLLHPLEGNQILAAARGFAVDHLKGASSADLYQNSKLQQGQLTAYPVEKAAETEEQQVPRCRLQFPALAGPEVQVLFSVRVQCSLGALDCGFCARCRRLQMC